MEKLKKISAFTVRLPDGLLRDFKSAVAHDGKTLSGAIRVMMREYIKNSELTFPPKETT